jgi:hypothetical protein
MKFLNQFILYRTHLINRGKVILSLSKDDGTQQSVFDMLRLTVLDVFENATTNFCLPTSTF